MENMFLYIFIGVLDIEKKNLPGFLGSINIGTQWGY